MITASNVRLSVSRRSSVDKVRQRIFSVYQINSQANSEFSFRNVINSSCKTMAWRDQVLDARFSIFLSEIKYMKNKADKIIVKQNCSKGYLRHVYIIFDEWFLEKSSSLPSVSPGKPVSQLSVFY